MKAVSNVLIALVVSSFSTACAHRRVAKNTQTAAPVVAAADANAEPSLRGSTMHSVPELKTVHFDYDRSMLRDEDRAVLASNARWLMEHADLRVQVAGHCDQRGTIEYNVALGQRRATAVREYYIHMGVPANRIATISYGQEGLLCRQSTESCWQQNRRAETLVASPNVADAR